MTETTTLFVMDENARPPSETRKHEILLSNGAIKSYTFTQNAWVEMPVGHAAKFLNDKAFHVHDKPEGEGTRIEPMVKPAEGETLNLKPNEVVATLEELLREALLIRAQMLPGGEDIKATSNKKQLIEFLTGKNSGTNKANNIDGPIPVDGSPDLTGGEMSDDELDDMFGDD